MLDQCVDHRLGVFALDPDQHHVTGMALNEGRDLAVVAAEQQVTFPSGPAPPGPQPLLGARGSRQRS